MNRVYRVANPDASNPQPPKLLDRLRQVLRTKHYAYRTEQAYVGWVRRFILLREHPHVIVEIHSVNLSCRFAERISTLCREISNSNSAIAPFLSIVADQKNSQCPLCRRGSLFTRGQK